MSLKGDGAMANAVLTLLMLALFTLGMCGAMAIANSKWFDKIYKYFN